MKTYPLFFMLLAFFMLGTATTVMAEAIACPQGQYCGPSLQQKIQRSYTRTHIAVLGSFEKSENPQLNYAGNGMAFMNVEFHIRQYLKGATDVEILKFRLPIYVPDIAQDDSPKFLNITKNYSTMIKNLEGLERTLEQGIIQKKDYRKKLSANRAALDVAEVAQTAFLVLVMPGGISPYREADVPIQFGQQYVLFLLTEIKGESQTLFPSNLDIYPVEGRINIRKIMQSLQNNK